MQLYCARQRRRLNRGLRRKQQSLLKRLRKAKKEAPPMEKPEVVKTHLRDMVILPEMVGSMVGVYNGKTFNQVEIKVGYLGLLETFLNCPFRFQPKFGLRTVEKNQWLGHYEYAFRTVNL